MAIKLKPREDKFFSYFEEIADAISEAADILKDFCSIKPIRSITWS